MANYIQSLIIGLFLVLTSLVASATTEGGDIYIYNQTNVPLTLTCTETYNLDSGQCWQGDYVLQPGGESYLYWSGETKGASKQGDIFWTVTESTQHYTIKAQYGWLSNDGANATLRSDYSQVEGSQLPGCGSGQSSIVGVTSLQQNGQAVTGKSMPVYATTYCDNSGSWGYLHEKVSFGPIWTTTKQKTMFPIGASSSGYLYSIPAASKQSSYPSNQKLFLYYGYYDGWGQFMEAHTDGNGVVKFNTYKTILNATCAGNANNIYTCLVDDFFNKYLNKIPGLGYPGKNSYLTRCQIDTGSIRLNSDKVTSNMTIQCLDDNNKPVINVCSNLNIYGSYSNIHGHVVPDKGSSGKCN